MRVNEKRTNGGIISTRSILSFVGGKDSTVFFIIRNVCIFSYKNKIAAYWLVRRGIGVFFINNSQRQIIIFPAGRILPFILESMFFKRVSIIIVGYYFFSMQHIRN